MRKQYIRRVKRALCLSEEEKQEMIRDLQEIFDSAVEHGETEEQVIAVWDLPRNMCIKFMNSWGKWKRSVSEEKREYKSVSCGY